MFVAAAEERCERLREQLDAAEQLVRMLVLGLRTIYLCPHCDAVRIRRFLDSGTPLPPDENPAAGIG